MNDFFYITDLEQLRVFSDPLRVKILWSFNGHEKTGKMLADEFNMAPPKIRYHLTELERVGLVKVVRTELKNGIQQKFYLPVAEKFSLEKVSSLLNGENFSNLDDVLKENAFCALEEMRRNLAEASFEKHELLQISYKVSLTRQEKKELAEKLTEIYEFVQQKSNRTAESTQNYYINLTMFPIVKDPKA